MDLDTFDHSLRALVAETGSHRPFLCDGSPFGCEIFAVGINPATDTPFWPYWNSNACDKAGWLRDYLTRHGRYRPTRARIERLCAAVAPARVLETNIFGAVSPRERDLAEGHRSTAVFDFLVDSLHPRVIFVHGKSAIDHLATMAGVALPLDEFTSATYRGQPIDVLTSHHLSFQCSYAKVDRIADALALRLQSQH